MNLLQGFQRWQAARDLRERRADFYYDLASALEDKVPLFTILRKYEVRARQRKEPSALLYREMLRKAQNGSLATALTGLVPDTEVIMLDAIQSSGDAQMATGLYFMAETVEKIDRMFRVVQKALTYPALLFVVFSAMMIGFASYAVPILEQLVPVEKWPAVGQWLHVFSSFIRQYWFYLYSTLALVLAVFFYSLPRWSSPLRRKLDRYLPYSIYREFSAAMLIVSLSSLMRTGVSLRSSLERARMHSSAWLGWHIREIFRGLANREASHFGYAFQTGLLNQMMEDRVQDASERRDPVKAFVKIGIGSIDRIERDIEASAMRLNTILIVVAGAVLLFMMMGFFMTAYSLGENINSPSVQP